MGKSIKSNGKIVFNRDKNTYGDPVELARLWNRAQELCNKGSLALPDESVQQGNLTLYEQFAVGESNTSPYHQTALIDYILQRPNFLGYRGLPPRAS